VATDVLVAQTVLDRMDQLDPVRQDAVARAIQAVGQAPAAPIRIDVPDGPPGAEYMALAPSDPDAPLVIYRKLHEGQSNPGFAYLVTALLDADKYQQYKQVEAARLLDDPAFKALVQGLAVGGLAYLVARWLSNS